MGRDFADWTRPRTISNAANAPNSSRRKAAPWCRAISARKAGASSTKRRRSSLKHANTKRRAAGYRADAHQPRSRGTIDRPSRAPLFPAMAAGQAAVRFAGLEPHGRRQSIAPAARHNAIGSKSQKTRSARSAETRLAGCTEPRYELLQ
jgi:hypothetical protein